MIDSKPSLGVLQNTTSDALTDLAEPIRYSGSSQGYVPQNVKNATPDPQPSYPRHDLQNSLGESSQRITTTILHSLGPPAEATISSNSEPFATWTTQPQAAVDEPLSFPGPPTPPAEIKFPTPVSGSPPVNPPRVAPIYWNEAKILRDHSDEVNGVVFSPDGKLVSSASDDETVILWNSALGVKLATLKGHENIVLSVAFSSDSEVVAVHLG